MGCGASADGSEGAGRPHVTTEKQKATYLTAGTGTATSKHSGAHAPGDAAAGTTGATTAPGNATAFGHSPPGGTMLAGMAHDTRTGANGAPGNRPIGLPTGAVNAAKGDPFGAPPSQLSVRSSNGTALGSHTGMMHSTDLLFNGGGDGDDEDIDFTSATLTGGGVPYLGKPGTARAKPKPKPVHNPTQDQ